VLFEVVNGLCHGAPWSVQPAVALLLHYSCTIPSAPKGANYSILKRNGYDYPSHHDAVVASRDKRHGVMDVCPDWTLYPNFLLRSRQFP